jgi:GNAT acetyltransferase-like protein
MLFDFIASHKLTPALEKEVDLFLDSQDCSHPFQFLGWTQTRRFFGTRSGGHCALLRDGSGGIRWFASCGTVYPSTRFVPRIRALDVCHGPVCDDPEIMMEGLRRLLEHGRQLGFAWVEITPEWIGGAAGLLNSRSAENGWEILPRTRSSLRLDLRADSNALLENFRKATRYEIRRSERQGISVAPAYDIAGTKQFLNIYFEMAAKKRFKPDQPKQLQHALTWISQERKRGTLLLATLETQILGGTVVIRAGKRCWYVLGATRKEDVVNVGHLLQWRAILWAKEQGCTEYDFGGYREDAKGGPAFFKRGFCSNVVHFPATLRYTLDPSLGRVSALVSKARRWPLLRAQQASQ